jgi:hypothetical protein
LPEEPLPEPAEFDPAPDALEDLAPPMADALGPTPPAEAPIAAPTASAPATAPVAAPSGAQVSTPSASAPAPAAPPSFELLAGEKEEPARAPTVSASAQEPAIVIVPTRLRAAADEDELGQLLPPPRYIKERTSAEEVPAGGGVTSQAARPAASPLVLHIPAPPDSAPLGSSAAPALPTPAGPAPEAQRCPATVITQVRSFEAGRLALVSGVLEPAFSSPYQGVSHRVVQGSTTVAFLLGARPELNLAQFSGRRVEVLGVLSESSVSRGDQLLQVSAVHPLD